VAEYPSRIVCLTEETTETLYLLGEGDRVVGVSGYTVRPPEARQKPKVSAFINARFDKIEALKPDLILAFSDLQADIARELIRRGYPVYCFNQRSVAEILQMIRIVGALVGRADKAHALAARIEHDLEAIRGQTWVRPGSDQGQTGARPGSDQGQTGARPGSDQGQTGAGPGSDQGQTPFRRPRVFFEEWPDPLISGIRWVEELVEIAGGDPIFPELRDKSLGKDRIVNSASVIERNPDVIIASWCGKAMKKKTITDRPGWDRINAVRDGRIHEIKSSYILQPGPASLTEGVRQLHAILQACDVS
jgi:iron complex transport system substrate-binding protein